MDSQQAFDRKRTKQQRWNRQDNYSSQPCSRDSSRREEGPPHRPGPSRKRDDRSRVRESNPRQHHLQRPRPDPEDPRDNPGHEVRQSLAPPKQPRPCKRRGRTLKHARPRVHPQRSISTNQARLRQHHHRLPPEHRTAHTQRASNLGLSTDTSPVRVLSHGRTVQSRTSSRSLDQPTPTSPHSRIFFTLFSESILLRTRGKPTLDYVRFWSTMTLA